MSLLITESTINKLVHNLRDIRQKALNEVNAKLHQSVQNEEDITFNCTALYKALIVALNEPKNNQSEVLNTLLTLFKSKYATSLVTVIGIPKIRNDMSNALRRVSETHNEFNPRINAFQRFLSQFEPTDNLTRDFQKKLTFNDDHHHSSDYIKCWSIPHQTDLEEMKTLRMNLMDHNNEENMEHAINFVRGVVKNLHGEFFLQPPYLYKSLFECLTFENYEKSILSILYDLTNSLRSRIKMRTMTRTCEFVLDEHNVREVTQLSIPAYCYKLMMTIISCLKEIEDHSNQERLNAYFELMNSIVNLFKECKGRYENRAVLRELTFFAKFYREQYQSSEENFKFRVNYLTVLQMIMILANTDSLSKEDPDVLEVGDTTETPIWKKELEISLLDLSLRETIPQKYAQIYELCKVGKNERLKQMVHAGRILFPAIAFLREPNMYNDEELIMNGLPMLDTLKIHRSEGLTRKLMTAVINCAPSFNRNSELRSHGEMLFLRLIATSVPKLKHLAYHMAVDAVKNFFTHVSDGTAGIRRLYEVGEGSSRYMGAPINSDILTEIICFGMRSENKEIRNGAETILMYIVKGQPLLGKHWHKYFEIILPLLPLLQAVTPLKTSLGLGILELLDPDFDLHPRDCIHGSMRYLFSPESQTREDALLRLLYMTINAPHTNNYLPNVDHIKDTLTNTFCIVRHRMPLRDPMKSGIYNVQILRDHIEILKCTDSSPQVRYSTLIQLNELMDDPSLCDILLQQNDWPFIVLAFDHAMRIDNTRDFPDSAVPALQIISKLCVRSMNIRRHFADDLDFNILLLRAMFMHHHDAAFRNDGATLIFLMAFSYFVIGEDDLSIPQVLSELFVPFQCKFHDTTSPYDVTSLLESMFQEENEEAYDDIVIVIDEETSPKVTRKFIPGQSEHPMYAQWQYIRMTFTTLWFDGSDYVLENASKKFWDTLSTKKYGVVDYKTLPQHLCEKKKENEIETEILDFNSRLELLETDLDLMKITSLSQVIKHNIYQIENATSHKEAAVGISGIKSVIFVPHYQEYHVKELIKSIKKFIVTYPKSHEDEYLFALVVNLLTRLIQTGYDTILVWAVQQLSCTNSIFLRMLHEKNQPIYLYNANIEFVQIVVKTFCCHNKTDENDFVLRIFEIISEELDTCGKNNVQSLLSLLRIITQYNTIETDDTLINKVIGQLFHCLKIMKSLTQSGSFIAKNCLFTIGNLMQNRSEFVFGPKMIRLLQALCGHTDFIVRGCAWTILSNIATTLNGAISIIDELSYLPGGIHACIISSMLDPEEVSLIKGAAATLFVDLLKFHDDSGLVSDVWPKCKESLPENNKKDGFGLIMEIFRKQQFYERVRDCLDQFVPSIYIDPDAEVEMLTSPDTVIHLSNIFISVSDVRARGFKLSENEKMIFEAFLKCTYTISLLNIGSTTLAMVTSICNLFERYLSHDITLLAIILHNSWFIVKLLKLLDMTYYETEEICELTCVNILHLIQVVASHPQGYEHICVSLEQIQVDNLMHFFNYNLLTNQHPCFVNDVMNCLTALLIGCPEEINISTPFHRLLDTVNIEDFVKKCENEENSYLQPSSEVMTERLIQFLFVVCEVENPKSGVFYISDLKLACYNCLQSLLRHTERAACVATNLKFFDHIIYRINSIACDVGMSSREYILKYGDRKKKPIIQELGLLASLISSWYCRVPMINLNHVEELLQSFNNVWDWTFHDYHLHLRFLTVLMILSEKSLIVCKALSTSCGLNQPPFLQRVADIAKKETTKPQEKDNERLKLAVRVLINCCSCIEGRSLLVKINILSVFESIHPQNLKKEKCLQTVIPIWLNFYEIFSRYPEGASAKHLNVLCTLARKQTKSLKLPALKILRNMSFLTTNRAALLTSKDFIYIVKEILDSGNDEEQLTIIVALWKIVANSNRHKNEIKNSLVYKKLNDLSNKLAVKNKTDTQIYEVLNCLLNVLSTND